MAETGIEWFLDNFCIKFQCLGFKIILNNVALSFISEKLTISIKYLKVVATGIEWYLDNFCIKFQCHGFKIILNNVALSFISEKF